MLICDCHVGPDVVIASPTRISVKLKAKTTVTEKQKTKCDLSVLHVESPLSQNYMSFILTVGFVIAGIYYTDI